MARTVLLADDSVTAQNMGRRILIDAGYDVVTVNNGSAALKRVHESRPDLIVLDVYMPGYGGLEVCQRLKESDETAKIPILLTVGKMEPFKTDEAKRVRADGHIVKPFEAGELLAALTRLEDRIVPQAEPARARKTKSEAKSEKKTKPSRAAFDPPSRTAFDPAMSYDDAHTDKIAYLEQVKQKNANGQPAEPAQESLVEQETPLAQDATSTKSSQISEGPEMPRPMSVYAADALREMPVVAATVPPDENQEQTGFARSDSDEAISETAAVPNAVTAQGYSGESVEIAKQAAEESPYEATGEVAVPSATEFVQSPQPATKSRWVAENIAVSAEEAALELDREMQQTQAVASSVIESPDQEPAGAHSAEASSESAPANAESAGNQIDRRETDGATFAAAAAAAAGSSADAVSSAPAASSPSESGPPVASEAAAAWQNWQHIRDSVMGSQTAMQLSESVAEALQSSVADVPQSETPEPNISQANGPAQATDDTSVKANETDDALSSIVDSVLAELKPKLMAEISKKLKK